MTLRELLVAPKRIEKPAVKPAVESTLLRIHEDTLARDITTGAPVLAYVNLANGSAAPLLRALRASLPSVSTFQERGRTNGLESRATTFGYQPRISIRRDYCGTTRLTREHPAISEQLFELGRLCAHHYADQNPGVFWRHVTDVETEVLPEWRIAGTPFTGGIINETVALDYHRDNGNYKGTWSAMVVLREHVEGGWLVVPELDLAIETADASLTMFYGQDFWHGVSALRRVRRDGRRYSIVFYSLKTMRNCLCREDELARYRTVRTVRERNRRAGVRAGDQ